MLDWSAKRITVNFDGWHFLKMDFPIKDGKRENFVSQWQNNKAEITYPLTLTGLVLTFNRKAAYVNEMVPVKDLEILLKDFFVYY